MNSPSQVGLPAERHISPWFERFKAMLFIVFCFEIGFFLLVFPWLASWDRTSIPVIVPWLAAVWDNTFFRGAISGLGAVNIYISMLEIGRLRRLY